MKLRVAKTQKEIEQDARKLVQVYEGVFRAYFEDSPVLSGGDRKAALWLAEKYPFDKAAEYVEVYFELENEWLEKQGFPFRYLPAQINAVIVQKKHLKRERLCPYNQYPNPEQTKLIVAASVPPPKELASSETAKKAVQAVMNGTFRLDDEF